MITELYFIRHGETETNTVDKFTGRYDARLTDKGIEQAKLCKKNVSALNFDRIFSSPLVRALKTAEIISGNSGEIKTDDRLSELDGGIWNGIYYKTIAERYPEQFKIYKTDLDDFKAEGGESVKDVLKRVKEFVSFIVGNYGGKKICVVSHAIVIRTLFAYYLNKNVRDIPFPTNASVSVLKFNGEDLCDVIYGKDDYMGNLKTNIDIELF